MNPIIITSKFLPVDPMQSFTLYPFILFREPYQFNIPLLNHELVHWREQRISWVVPWFIQYFFSAKFRYKVELAAYIAQCNSINGPALETAARLLSDHYGLPVEYSYTRALKDLTDACV